MMHGRCDKLLDVFSELLASPPANVVAPPALHSSQNEEMSRYFMTTHLDLRAPLIMRKTVFRPTLLTQLDEFLLALLAGPTALEAIAMNAHLSIPMISTMIERKEIDS